MTISTTAINEAASQVLATAPVIAGMALILAVFPRLPRLRLRLRLSAGAQLSAVWCRKLLSDLPQAFEQLSKGGNVGKAVLSLEMGLRDLRCRR